MRRLLASVVALCVCVLCVPVSYAAEAVPGSYVYSNDTEFPEWMWEVPSASIDNLFLPHNYVVKLAREFGAPTDDVEQVVFDGMVYIVTGDTAWARYTYDLLPGKKIESASGNWYADGVGVRLTDCILNTPIKTQGEHNCWAACCASIISYKTLESPTASEVCRKIYPLNGDHGGSMQDAIKALSKYGLNAELFEDVLPFRGSGLQSVKYQLEHSCPMFCRCISQAAGADSDTEHAVVLRGFREEGDRVRLYIMDPATASFHDYSLPAEYDASDTYFGLAPGVYVRWASTLYSIYKR